MDFDILIINDENDICKIVSRILRDKGYRSRIASKSDFALEEINDRILHLIFLDIWLRESKLDWLELLDDIKRYPRLPIIMISGHGNIEKAVSKIRRGAYDFIEKLFEIDRLILITERALEASKLQREVFELREKTIDTSKFLGNSPMINRFR